MREELIYKAKKADSADALMALLGEEGLSVSMEDAISLYERIHSSGEINDDELSSVSGGCGGTPSGGGSTTKEDDSGYSLDTGDEAYILWGQPCMCGNNYVEVLYCNGGYDTASKRYMTKCTECGQELVYWAYELKKVL